MGGMNRCRQCHAVGSVGPHQAHFGWCIHVGGTGYHPAWHRASAAIAASAATPPPEPPSAPPACVPAQTNNGWWKPKRPAATVPDCPPDVMQASPLEGKRASRQGPRPGRELDKDVRALVNKVCDQGWTYSPGNTGGGSGHPEVVSPTGRRVRVPAAGAKTSNRHVVGRIKKAGARL